MSAFAGERFLSSTRLAMTSAGGEGAKGPSIIRCVHAKIGTGRHNACATDTRWLIGLHRGAALAVAAERAQRRLAGRPVPLRSPLNLSVRLLRTAAVGAVIG